jgi:hypothetical protein
VERHTGLGSNSGADSPAYTQQGLAPFGLGECTQRSTVTLSRYYEDFKDIFSLRNVSLDLMQDFESRKAAGAAEALPLVNTSFGYRAARISVQQCSTIVLFPRFLGEPQVTGHHAHLCILLRRNL